MSLWLRQPSTEPTEGTPVLVPGGEKPFRPGVVLRAFPVDGVLMVFVPWGTGTLRSDLKHVTVRPGTAEGRVLQLDKVTYFYKGNVTRCRATQVKVMGNALCSPRLMLDLREVFGF